MTSLLWAADMGNLDVLELLIRCGADLDAQDENGLTALLWASDRGHVDCVRVLLAAHANVNSTDAVSTTCNYVILNMHVLLKCVLLVCAQNSYTALHRASNAGSVEIVKALVEGKADLALVDKVGSALSIYPQCGPFSLLRFTLLAERDDGAGLGRVAGPR
jgi:ankyrin repeat protein